LKKLIMSITQEDRLERLERAKQRMEKERIALMLVYGDAWRDGNLRYFAGVAPFSAKFTASGIGPFALLAIPAKDQPVYFCPDFLVDSVKMEVETIQERWLKIEPWSKCIDTLEQLKKRAGSNGVALSGEDIVPHVIHRIFKQALGEMSSTNIPECLRIIKSQKEIALLEKAANIADELYEDITRNLLKKGKTEMEMARQIMIDAISKGADEVASDILVMTGPYTETRLGKARDVPVARDQLVEFHICPRYQNYCCDSDRAIGFGRITKEQKELLDVAEQAHEKGREAIRPGVKGSDVFQAERSVNKSLVGTTDAIVYGHGIGLQVEEIGFIDDWTLEPGMVFTLAGGTYKKGVGAVRIEDVCVVTERGGRCLNKFDRAPMVL
jgi:Xaa-Pro aminopeptidase